jgi:hypothetical protein
VGWVEFLERRREMQSIRETIFDRLAGTGVNAPGTLFSNCSPYAYKVLWILPPRDLQCGGAENRKAGMPIHVGIACESVHRVHFIGTSSGIKPLPARTSRLDSYVNVWGILRNRALIAAPKKSVMFAKRSHGMSTGVGVREAVDQIRSRFVNW